MGAFFTTVFGSLFGFFAQYLTKKIAYAGLVTAAIFAAVVAFYAAMQALTGSLAYVITDKWLLMGFYAVLPSNLSTCLTAIWSAEILAYLYRHQILMIKTVSQAT